MNGFFCKHRRKVDMENFALKKIAKTSIISNYFPLIQWIKKLFHLYPPFSLIFGKGSNISFFFVKYLAQQILTWQLSDVLSDVMNQNSVIGL